MPDLPESELSFEQALTQLEQIVANLERGEPELTTALATYQTGARLLTLCYRLLDQAEQSVALLTGVDDQGNPQRAPYDASATVEGESSSPTLTNPDRIPRKTSTEPPVGRNRNTSLHDFGEAFDPPF
jgi:exodeoxyribonuclease VII small subunit